MGQVVRLDQALRLLEPSPKKRNSRDVSVSDRIMFLGGSQ